MEQRTSAVSEVIAVVMLAFFAWAIWHYVTDQGPAAPAPDSHVVDTYVPGRILTP